MRESTWGASCRVESVSEVVCGAVQPLLMPSGRTTPPEDHVSCTARVRSSGFRFAILTRL